MENAVFRYKTIIGRCMRSRTLAGQREEVQLACRILNTMTLLGMPDSYHGYRKLTVPSFASPALRAFFLLSLSHSPS